jgi:peptide/nickel transport system substrate-binding protein
VSRSVAVAVAIVVVIAIIAAAVVLTRPSKSVATSSTTQTSSPSTTTSSSSTSPPTSSTTSSTSTSSSTVSSFVLKPSNSSEFVDNYQVVAPDSLDPALAFDIQDEPLLTAVYQELVEFNGSSISQVLPVLASNYSTSNNNQTYTFTIRPNVTFSNGDPMNAATVWFSYVRELYDGQAVGISNYEELTLNLSETSATGYNFPWGIRAAIQSVTGLPATTNVSVAVEALNNIMSHFNPENATIQKIMAYPNQAYVVPNNNTFRVNLLKPYNYFALDIASWWGAVVDPVFVDAHGGVQGNQASPYFNVNGGPGTGPYEIASVGTGLTPIVLKQNPRYWAQHGTGILQPPHIPVIIINYALSSNDQLESFATNQAQLSFANVPSLGQMYSAYQYKQYYSFNQIFLNLGPEPGVQMISLNTQKYPTNNVDFRLAIAHAINFTYLLDALYTFNGQQLAQPYVGPISQQFPTFYNPDNLPPYSYNLNLAAYYLNLAGQQENFSVTMPNGTVLGNPNSPPLQPQTIIYPAPISTLTETEMTIIVSELSKLGLTIGIQGESSSVFYVTWTTSQLAPAMTWFAWYPDWPDPIFQQLAPAVTTTSDFPAWMNLSSVNQIMATLPFLTNISQQRQLVAEVYNITYNYAPYVWLPNPATYFFIQPYVKGFVYNPFAGYFYNELYYSTA